MLREQGNLPWVWVVSWASAPTCLRGSEVRTRGPDGSWMSRLQPAQSERRPWRSQSHQGCCLPPRRPFQNWPQRAPDTPSQCCWQLCSSSEGRYTEWRRTGVRTGEKRWYTVKLRRMRFFHFRSYNMYLSPHLQILHIHSYPNTHMWQINNIYSTTAGTGLSEISD